MRFLLGLLMLVISGSALATIDVMQFKDEAQVAAVPPAYRATALS